MILVILVMILVNDINDIRSLIVILAKAIVHSCQSHHLQAARQMDSRGGSEMTTRVISERIANEGDRHLARQAKHFHRELSPRYSHVFLEVQERRTWGAIESIELLHHRKSSVSN